MVVVSQGDIVWAHLREPVGSEPGYERPVLIIQCDEFNHSMVNTVICVPLTGNLGWARSPTSVLIKHKQTGLDRDSVAQTHLVTTLDRTQLGDWIGRVSELQIRQVFTALDRVLGR